MKKPIVVLLLIAILTSVSSMLRPVFAQDNPIADWVPMGDDKVKPLTSEEIEKAVEKCLKKGSPTKDKKEFFKCLSAQLGGKAADKNKELIICTMFSVWEKQKPGEPSSICDAWPACSPCADEGECGRKYQCQQCCDLKRQWCYL